MKIAIYCRVSTRDQNPQCQRRELEEYARRMNHEFEVFEEIESSRKTRPVKEGLLRRLRSKEFDGVLVWRLDRWARSLSELVLEIQELHDKAVSFVSLKEGIDLGTATGKLQFHLICSSMPPRCSFWRRSASAYLSSTV